MKNTERIIYGLVITTAIFIAATIVSVRLHLENNFVPGFFVSLTIELIMSVIAIYFMRANLSYRIALPQLKTIIKPVIYALLATIVINGLMNLITKLAGREIEIPETLAKLKPLQVLIFLFFYASIAEEFLFRGFLLNLLKPLNEHRIFIFKRKISLAVMLSALAFGAAHLVLITTGVSAFFLLRIIIFTICLGTIAGYYHEKHNNHSYAIIVHMAGNSLAVIGAFAMH